jgi:hypothetical protein
MNDQIWQSIRYLLIFGGGILAGRGKISADEVAPLADSIIQVGGAIVSVGAMLWGLYVKWKTRAVPFAVAARPDVPTVSAATGAVETEPRRRPKRRKSRG